MPVHELLVLIACAQIPLINPNAEASSGAQGPNYGLKHHLNLYFVYASREALMSLRIFHLKSALYEMS